MLHEAPQCKRYIINDSCFVLSPSALPHPPAYNNAIRRSSQLTHKFPIFTASHLLTPRASHFYFLYPHFSCSVVLGFWKSPPAAVLSVQSLPLSRTLVQTKAKAKALPGQTWLLHGPSVTCVFHPRFLLAKIWITITAVHFSRCKAIVPVSRWILSVLLKAESHLLDLSGGTPWDWHHGLSSKAFFFWCSQSTIYDHP